MRGNRPVRPSRRYRRRRRRSARTYSLDDLLARQPKTLRKHSDYPQLVIYLSNSNELKRLRIPRRCYLLLHEARVDPDNLEHFRRTYRLPQHPFLPLFLRIKRDYLAGRARLAEERSRYILERVRSLPQSTVAFVRYLGYLENHYNVAGAHPLWDRHLFPSSKKQVHEYLRYTQLQWISVFRRHMDRLERRYRACLRRTSEALLACFILDCLPAELPPVRPPAALVKRRYRELSLQHHPDHGGDAAVFVQLQNARDVLINEQRADS